MASPGMASMGDLRVELEPSSSRETQGPQNDFGSENGDDVAAAEDDDIWGGDASDSPGHASTLDRERIHRQNQFHKMGYRDGITQGQKDPAQEGFNVGFRQSAHLGYKWGLVRGVTSALVSLQDSSKEKLLPNVQCRGKLQDLHNCLQEISADDALQKFDDTIRQNNRPSGEEHVTLGEDGATDSNRLTMLSKDLVLLLHECRDVKLSKSWHEVVNKLTRNSGNHYGSPKSAESLALNAECISITPAELEQGSLKFCLIYYIL